MGIITRAIALTVAAVATVVTVATGAQASAPVGTITTPAVGISATVGETVTVSAETDGACAPSLTVQPPAGESVLVVTGNPGPMCGPVSFSGGYVPERPGKHTIALVTAKGDALAEVEVSAVNPPTTPLPTPTVTVTHTAEANTPTPTVTTTATATPTATKTVTAKPKATPTVTRTRTVKVTSTPAVQPAPQALPQQGLPVVPQPLPTPASDSDVKVPAASQVPAPQVAEQDRDEIPAWLAYQLARQEQTPAGPSFGTVVGAVVTVLAPLAAIGGLVWWLIYRRQRAGRNPQ
ncbi:hypothetical protein [Nonomuraea sp. NPDC005650]|uniref:hypothetical protein n=1 Tax=Nonomuraea sp. NPDC005650 TaxID=3157045 RepID=UPI0033A4881C